MGTTLLKKRSIYIHIPKTGGNWVNQIIKDCKVRLLEPKPHPTLNDLRGYKKFYKFAFVRDPLTWWKSRWRFRLGKPVEFEGIPSCPDKCLDKNFNKFIENVLETCPGYCSDFYELFVGKPEEEIDYIGRFENLKKDLMSALDTIGLDYDKKKIYTVPPRNQSKHPDVKYDPALAKALQEAEKKAMDRFNY